MSALAAAALPVASAAAAVVQLPWRRAAWRGPSGSWSGVGLGSSIDFQDHRPYSPGDDLRYVNWGAYARTDALLLKLHRHEAAPAVDLVCDVSASMWLGAAKARRSAELFLFALEGAERHGSSVRCYAARGATIVPLQPAQLRKGAWPAPEEFAGTPAFERVPWRPEALRIVISDLLFPGASEGWIRRLGGPRGLGVVLVPWAKDEAEPAWDGRMEFEDCESGRRREQRVEPEMMERYRAAYGRHVAGWREAARRAGVAAARVPAEPALTVALSAEALPGAVLEPAK